MYNNTDIKIMDKPQDERWLWTRSLLMIALWLLSWTPYAAVVLLTISGYGHLINIHLDMIPGNPCPQLK